MKKQHSKYTFKGHGGAITSLAFSPDAQTLLSTSYDNCTLVWNVATANIRKAIPISRWENCHLFPDSSRIVDWTGIWDIATGERVRRHRKGDILACSPDGKLVASDEHASNPETYTLSALYLFDSRNGRTKHTVWTNAMFPLYEATSFVFSPDGAFLAFLGREPFRTEIRNGNGEDYEWRVNGNATVYVYELKTRNLVAKSANSDYWQLFWTVSPSSTRLIAMGSGGATLWDAENGKLLLSVSEQSDSFLSPDGSLLARATTDGCVEVYSVAETRLLWRRRCHQGWVRTVAFTSDSRRLASAGDDLAILIHEAETGELMQKLTGRVPRVEAISFTQEGDQLSALYNDNSVRLWELEPRALKRQSLVSMELVTHLGKLNSQKALHYWNLPFKELPVYSDERPLSVQSISLDGALVALKSPRIMRYGVERLDQKLEQKAVPDEERSARASLAEQSLVSALRGTEDNHKIVIWNIETQSALCTISAPKIHDCVILPDNRRCAISHVESVTIYALATGEVLQKLAFDHDLDQVYGGDLTLSSDGNLLAHVEYLGAIRIWDLQTGKRLDTDASAEDGLDIAFFPDGERIITSLPHEEYAWIWRLSSKSKPRRLEGHLSSVRAVACSPDGRLVATGAQDGAVKVWDATSGTLLATYQALPEAEAWVVHTPEGEVTGSSGAEAYLMENIEREMVETGVF